MPDDDQLRERIAEWMRFSVVKLRISQVELASLLGTTEATISRVLHGKMTPGLDTFVRLRFHLPESADRMIGQDPPWAEVGGRSEWERMAAASRHRRLASE